MITEGALLHVRQSANGIVYGIHVDGVVTRLCPRGVRALTLTQRSAVGFDDCEAAATYIPTPKPTLPIDEVQISEDGRCVLLSSVPPSLFGVMRLDQGSEIGNEEWSVPYKVPEEMEGAEVIRVCFLVNSVLALKGDGTIAVYNSSEMSFPQRLYRMKRDAKVSVGIGKVRRAHPVDMAPVRRIAWGRFCIVVLYEDCCLYVVCPILPTGEMEDEILSAAERRLISRELLRGLLTEAMGDGEEGCPENVPVMQGPINAGLPSEWEEEFGEGHCDKAVALTCAACGDACVTVTVATARGVIYSHALIENLAPKIVPLATATITSSGVRICPLKASGVCLRLVEIIHLGKTTKHKQQMCLWQDPCHPEVAYCRWGVDLCRVRFLWVVSVLSKEMLDTLLENSTVWKFKREAGFLGSFHDLDASIAVFKHGNHTSASIFRPSAVSQSFMEKMPSIPLEQGESSKASESNEDIGEALPSMQDPSFGPLKEAFRRYEYLSLESEEFDESLEKIQDESSVLQDLTSDIDTLFRSLKLQTTSSVRLMHDLARASCINEAIREEFKMTDTWLGDISTGTQAASSSHG